MNTYIVNNVVQFKIIIWIVLKKDEMNSCRKYKKKDEKNSCRKNKN